MSRLIKYSWLAALIAAAIFLLFLFGDRDQFFESYLISYLFFLGLALGSLAILMIFHLTGGGWGIAARPYLLAAARTLPLLTVLFVPLLLGMGRLYPWVHAGSRLKGGNAFYLQTPFFLARAAFYFISWNAMAYWIERRPHISALGLVLYGLTMTFAAFDWLMSLDPNWSSTVFGVIVIMGQCLSAFAFATIGMCLELPPGDPARPDRQPIHDMGNFLLATLMFWAYVSFSQLIIIWSGNLLEEIPWYVRRSNGGWQWVISAIAFFYFAAPFFFLLMRGVKRRPERLMALAAFILFMRLVDLNWLVRPEFQHSVLQVNWLDSVSVVAIGGAWLAVFLKAVKNGGRHAARA